MLPSDPETPTPDPERGRIGRVRIAAWSAAALLLLLPLVAMQLSDEVHWTASDFVFAGVLILSVGVPLELVVRTTGDTLTRAAFAVALGTAFVLVWANGAVGLIGAETNGVNALYGGVLAVGLAGAGLARLRPGGMALALTATALAQAAVAAGALVAGLSPAGETLEVLVVNGVFVALWLGAAALFRQAASRPPRPA